MRIVCVGGGPAGLYFAILAKKADPRHDITVIERNAAGQTFGWGVVFWDDLVDQVRASDPTTAALLRDHAYQWTDQVVTVRRQDDLAEPAPRRADDLGRREQRQLPVDLGEHRLGQRP